MKKYLKLALYVVLGVLLVWQFIRPERNVSGDTTYAMAKRYPVPAEVSNLLAVACNDCHSNTTRYPWYANVQPVATFLANHVEEGKHHLNFDEFLKRPVAIQNHKFEEIIEEVKEHNMPMSSYTWLGLHSDAKLTDAQRAVITNWAQTQMDSLKAQYPADSLVMPKRGGPPPPGR